MRSRATVRAMVTRGAVMACWNERNTMVETFGRRFDSLGVHMPKRRADTGIYFVESAHTVQVRVRIRKDVESLAFVSANGRASRQAIHSL
jgi:hypothetical protein